MAAIDLHRAALSRRMVLRGAAILAGGGVALVSAAAAHAADAPAKKAQASVAYQTTPKGSARCIACDQFLQPNACKTVEGVINPTGWCNLYSPKW
jgi:hypothetical protein